MAYNNGFPATYPQFYPQYQQPQYQQQAQRCDRQGTHHRHAPAHGHAILTGLQQVQAHLSRQERHIPDRQDHSSGGDGNFVL